MNKKRIGEVRKYLKENSLDALLVTNMSNVFYLSGFTGSTAALIVARTHTKILVDPRYTAQAAKECGDQVVNEYFGRSLVSAIADFLDSSNIETLGYESSHVTMSVFHELRRLSPKTVSLRATKNVVEDLRKIKDADEVDAIEKCAKIADDTLERVIPQIKTGMTEKQLALLIDVTLRELGADKEAFETIAASGPNSAYPHASPTDRKISEGDFVKMDFGARLDNYNSDITRTVVVGKPTAKHIEIYETVLGAQKKAIDSIRPGLLARDIDWVARNEITEKGYGPRFGHGLGHGLGIEVHDGPGPSKTSETTLAQGMVMTIEPGIYIEDYGGVRIEDDVVVTASGCKVLTHFTKDLISIEA